MNRSFGASLWRGLAFGLLALACSHAATPAVAQNQTCPTAPVNDSTNKCASTAFVQNQIAAGGGGLVIDGTVISGVGAIPNGLLFNHAGKVGNLATANSGVVVTNSSGVPSVTSGPLGLDHGGMGATSFTANKPILGNGTSNPISGASSGNTNTFATTNGALISGNCVQSDVNHNLVDTGGPCGAGAAVPHTQDFVAPGDFTPGSTTSLVLSSTPTSNDLLTITFDGIGQNKNTWSLATATVTFLAAIPANVQVVEAKWSTATTTAGVNSLTAGGNTLAGAVNLLPGNGTAISSAGQNITIGNSMNVVSITDAAYGAKCDAIFQSNQNFDYPATNLSITSAATLLTSSGSTFTAADVGKRIYVPGAGVAGAALSTTIASFVGATQVNVTLAAGTTISVQAATNTSPFVYGTDDTAAIQAAMNAVPIGGTLYIPGQRSGCLIRQQGANAYALLQNRPFSIRGDGHFSNLMTFPDTPSTVDNLFIDGTAGWDWGNLSWFGFSIGASNSFIPPTFLMYRRYGKRGIVFSDSAAANFVNIAIDNVRVGESGNDHSLYIGNSSSSPSQTVLIDRAQIFGGIKLDNVSDSFRITRGQFYGASTFGGLFSFVGGAGKFEFSSNNVVWVGCTVFNGGTAPSVINNYFEEVTTASSCTNNAMVDFNGGGTTVAAPIFENNIVGALVSTTVTPVRYGNVTGGAFGKNYISTSTGRTGVTSTTQLNCSAPNTWNSATPHFSTALASPNPFTC